MEDEGGGGPVNTSILEMTDHVFSGFSTSNAFSSEMIYLVFRYSMSVKKGSSVILNGV